MSGSHRGGCAGRRGEGRAVFCGAAARSDHAHSQRRRSARALPGRARPAVSVHQCKSATPFGRSDDHPVGRVFRMPHSAGTGRSAGMALGRGVACGGALRILRLPRRRRGGVVEADRSRTRVAGRRARSSDAMARGFDKGDRRERGNVAFFRALRPPGDATRGALTPGGLQFGEAAAESKGLAAASKRGMETFDAEWLVGADGGRSTVRKCTDVGFDGFTWDERFVVASTPYDYAPHGYALNAYLADPEEWAALFKMPDDGPPGIWRVIFPVPPEEEDAVTLSEEMVERRMQNFLPRKERYQVKYKSIYKVHQRVAKDFRLGRVLLAGDAAHLNNPMGAFGLNGGIHDSFNLTEKLGKVCRGEADETLLDLYVRQRRTVNLEYVQEHSIKNLRRLNEKSEEGRRKNFDELRRQAGSREGRREFLQVSSMIASVRRANAIT